MSTTAVEILGGEIPSDLMSEQTQQSEQQLDMQNHKSIPDDLLILGEKNLSMGERAALKSSSAESHPQEPGDGDGKTWSQWAAEKAIVAENVAAEGAVMVKDSAVSTLKYVTGAAASKLHSITEPAIDSNARNNDVGSGDKTNSVQDIVDRYSQLKHSPHPDSPTASRAATIKERTLNMAESFKQSTASALTPGDGDKELAKNITASLSSFPTLLRARMWVSSNDAKEKSLDGKPTSANSDLSPDHSLRTAPLVNGVAGIVSSASLEKSLQLLEQAIYEPKSESRNSTKVTDEEKLDAIEPGKLMELWTIGNEASNTVTSGAAESESLLYPRTPNTPTLARAAAPVSPKAPTLAPAAAQESPKSPTLASSARMTEQTNAKIAEAHQSRVIAEANAYVEAELSKAEAHAQKMHAEVDTHRFQEEARAIETLKKEELRAELLFHNAEVKAEEILREVNSKAALIAATAKEEYATIMADAKTKSDMSLAEIAEAKQRGIAELHDRVEEMILMREFPLAVPERKKDSVVKKVKGKVLSHIRGY